MLLGPSLTKVGHVSEFTQWILPAMGRHRRHKSLLVGLSLSSTAFMELKTAQDIPQHLVIRVGQLFDAGSFWYRNRSAACSELPSQGSKTQKPKKEVKLPFLEHGNAEGVFHAPAAREVQRAAEIPRCFS